jgi:CheY-like chemotaxis protein
MVYGFVKQSKGHVRIYSEPGQGTTVKLYLPRAGAAETRAATAKPETAAERGEETILLVEDDEMVRENAAGQLASLGYRVVSARNGPDALDALKHNADIGLLFTDIVMPGGMNGRQLAEEVLKLRPGLPVLFTSGYTENAIVHHGRLDRGVHLIAKPYRRQDLAAKIRDVLGKGPGPAR